MRAFLRWWVVIVVVLVLLGLHGLGWLRPVEGAFASIVRPVQRLFSSWTLGLRYAPSEDAGKRIEELEAHIARLITENVLLKEEQREQSAEEQQANFLAARGLSGVSTTIIGKSPEGDEQFLILDRGTESGIREGLPVITEEGILVGTIHEAENGRSSFTTLTDSQSSVAAEVENSARSPGLVQGQHGLTMTMRFIPQNEPVETDQAVVTSAVNERIPANLTIGTITEVHFATGDLFQEASLRPLVDSQRLRYVMVLLPL